jgi:hypothetical protein
MNKGLLSEEFAKIIFQRDDRITKDALSQRSDWAKLRDNVMVYHHRSGCSSPDSSIEKLRKQLFIEFEETVKVKEAHPKALINAAKELKTLGFTNEQVNEIKDEVAQFILNTLLTRYTGLEWIKLTEQAHPNFITAWNDDSFLGTAFYCSDKKVSGCHTMSQDGQQFKNNILTEQTEPLAYGHFVKHMDEALKTKPDLLTIKPS